MAQSLFGVLVLVLLFAGLPWALKAAKKRFGLVHNSPDGQAKIVSVVALGQTQRVVTVEVGPSDAKVWLVLGVTAQAVTCLHTIAPPALPAVPALVDADAA
jgi:flagellar protein FliO/FliZ